MQPSGRWWTSGCGVNHSGAVGSYTLVVDFVSVPGSTVVSTSVIHLRDVPAGKAVSWWTQGGRAGQHLTCILRYAQTG